jgi:hypothetical protein
MTAVGSAYLTGLIRIDEHAGGRVVGRVVVRDRSPRRRDDGTAFREFRVGRRDYEELRRLISESRLWGIHPQYWGYSDPNAICLDGIEFAFERLDAAGYRFSWSNAQCTMPADIRRVASKIIDLSGEPRLHRLLL